MYKQSAEYIKKQTDIVPKIGVILGTGLNHAGDILNNPTIIPYSEILNFPVSTVKEHRGRLLIGELYGKGIAIMQGRVHFYEGYSMSDLSVPVRVMKELGVETLIITNASGAINGDFSPGDMIVIKDHIKMGIDSPVRGENIDEFGPRFFDMTDAYSKRLRGIAEGVLKEIDIPFKEGVYAYMGGPQFETPAEINMLRILGADLVGMSTVPEVITAVHSSIEVLAISCVTNMAAGMKDGGLNKEVICEAEDILKDKVKEFILKVVEKI